MIPEPQRTYLLELLTALGSASEGLILAGAQALKFVVAKPRATRDFDFILDVALLRESDVLVSSTLASLGYSPVENARDFQFEKQIPDSIEVMRIEFMAPAEYSRRGGVRVDVQDGIHGRACDGGLVALNETVEHEIVGSLPNGQPARANVRATRAHALVMMKCLAMDDRYRNLRGPARAVHDRNEARIHAGDIVAIMRAQADFAGFRERFSVQFRDDVRLKERVYRIIVDYFGDESRPGLVLYGELLAATLPPNETVREGLVSELRQAQRLVASLIL